MTYSKNTISLERIEDYSYYEIFAILNSSNRINIVVTTGKIPTGKGTAINAGLYYRCFIYSDGEFTVENAIKIADSSSQTSVIIPYKIVGYV